MHSCKKFPPKSQDIVAIAIAVVGYLSGAAAMAAYADQLGVNGSNMYSSSAAATSVRNTYFNCHPPPPKKKVIKKIELYTSIYSVIILLCLILSFSLLQAFSFFSMFVHIGMIIYFLVARYALKWSTHGEESTGGKSQDNYQVDQ